MIDNCSDEITGVLAWLVWGAVGLCFVTIAALFALVVALVWNAFRG